jgi:hypothetical protein
MEMFYTCAVQYSSHMGPLSPKIKVLLILIKFKWHHVSSGAILDAAIQMSPTGEFPTLTNCQFPN